MTKKSRIAIIGGGLTGLTAGYRLSRCGYEVHLFEANSRPGGMIAGEKMPSGYLDDIYHHLFTSDHYLLELLQELDLTENLLWTTANNALLSGQRLYSFASPLDLLRFRPLPFLQRLRTGLSVLRAARLKDWSALEGELVSEWIINNCGSESWQTLWSPLLSSKFGRDATEISAVWIWNKFKLRGGSRESGKEKLGYITGGFQLVADRLKAGIVAEQGMVNLNSQVTEIFVSTEPNQGRYGIKVAGKNYEHFFAQVICATAAEPFLTLTNGILPDDDYKARLVASKHKANLCLIVCYEQQFSPWYWTTICDELPFVVVVEQDKISSLPECGHPVYFSRYLDVEDELWHLSDSAIRDQFLTAAVSAFPGTADNKVLTTKLIRTRYAQPVIERHYSRKMPAMKTPLPGLWLAGMAQIYPEDRGLNYAVRLAEELAAAVIGADDD